jgi:ATP-dependent DNA helicase RecG
MLRFADPEKDADLLAAARIAAEEILRDDSASAQRHLQRWLGNKSQYLQA